MARTLPPVNLAEPAAPQRTVPQWIHPLGVLALGTLMVLGYAVLVGGTSRGDLSGPLRLMNGIAAGLFTAYYVLRAPSAADKIDRRVLVALLLFLAAAVLSQFPRQSLDAALGALTAVAFLFVARGELARREVRAAFVILLTGLCVVMTLLTAARWIPLAVEWWALTEWTVVPPLDLNFDALPWGHRHDLTLLLVLLYPALWIGRPSPIRRSFAVVLAVLIALLVVIDGSRNLWLAILGSSVLTLAVPTWRLVRLRVSAAVAVALAGGLALIAIIFVSALDTTIGDRLANLGSLGWRYSLWQASIEAWTERPLAGFGPGSFPWILQTTDYFQTSAWNPRHPDNAFFQLLAEGGFLGLAAAGTILITFVRPVLRARSMAARWALITFLLAGIGANPTDFAFLVAVALAWTAYAVPRETPTSAPALGRTAPAIRAALIACLVVLGVAYAATVTAVLIYEQARDSVNARDFAAADNHLDLAIQLDPGQALYYRQRGTLELLQQNSAESAADLEAAVRLNPSDDKAWRSLSLAYAVEGNQAAADAALGIALEGRRSDPANLLLQAKWSADQGRPERALAILGEVVQAWPAIIGAPGWQGLPPSISTADVLEEAIRRWETGLPSPEPFSGQGLWLAVLGDRPDLLESASLASGVSESLVRAASAVFQCDSEAGSLLDGLSDTDRRTLMYWLLKVRLSARLDSTVDRTALRQVELMRGWPIEQSKADDRLSPLEQSGLSSEIFGYRREPIAWPDIPDDLPSPEAGEVRWLLDPAGAMREAGLEAMLPACR